MRSRNASYHNKTDRSYCAKENDSFSARAFKHGAGTERSKFARRCSAAPPLFVTEDPEGTIVLPNLTEYRVKNREEVLYLVIKGNMERTVAETSANSFSSRSHAILQFNITQHFEKEGRVLNSKVSLIDLAGSERANYHRLAEHA